MIEIEFDLDKDILNRRKHGVSLKEATFFDMDAALVDVDRSQDYGELRFIGVGWLRNLLHTMTFTVREDRFRIINLRRSTVTERRMEEVDNEYGQPDAENPEWTKEQFARARRGRDVPEIKRALDAMRAKSAGENRSPESTLVLADDIAQALQATGPDWQKRAEDVLREKFVTKAA